MTLPPRVSDERLAELIMATDMRGRYEPADYCKRIDNDTATALRELASSRAGEAQRWVAWKPGDAIPPQGTYWVTRTFANGYAQYLERRQFTQAYHTDEWNKQPMHPIIAYWSSPMPEPYVDAAISAAQGKCK